MRALFAVYKREVALYFKSFIAYGITFALMFFMGIYFQGTISYAAQSPGSQTAAGMATNLLQIFVFLLFLISPLLTMRLLSEEAREGTLELLMTLPMSEWVFVLGKFLAAWTFYSFILGLTLIHVLMLGQLGTVNLGVFFVAYLGAWLYGGATMAICLIWSAITEDQIVSAFLGATTILALFLSSELNVLFGTSAIGAQLGEIVREIGLTTHYHSSMADGVLRAEDITYYLLIIIVSIFLSTLIVGIRRWRAS